ncbi:MAG: ABC transporter substrate-binding protein, partial [Syntrophaceae bacterium]|nr:ABC transporter substrate-binding protein [Syntrophaceae bacterium]
AKMMDEVKAKGVNVYDLPKEQEAAWFKEFQETTRQWADELAKKGLQAKEAVLMYNQIANELGTSCVACPPEWTEQEKK